MNKPLKATLTPDQLTGILAERVLLWRATPDRFLTGKRAWLPRWRFQPLLNLEDAFRLLEKAATDYTLTATADGTFTAHICVADRTGSASGKSRAATITLAIARAIGLDVPKVEARKE
jgi:hypothetical protein